MIFRTYLGLELGCGTIRGVALRRRRGGASLTGWRSAAVAEEVLTPSAWEENVRDPARLAGAIRTVLDPLAGGEDRVALSLPPTAGGFSLIDMETSFGSRDEGEEILRWQLKGRLGIAPQALRLDYQVLRETETGRRLLAVAWMNEAVAGQYEEVVEEAGYGAAFIDLQPLNVYGFYRSRLDLGEDFVLIGVERSAFFLFAFHDSAPVFYRSRELAGEPEELFRELNQTLAGRQEEFPALRRGTIYLNCIPELEEPWVEAVRAAFGREPVLLEPHLERMSSVRLDLESWEARRLAAAIGAAERMM